MSPSCEINGAFRVGFPRVSGDEPTYQAYTVSRRRFSPRERG